MPNEYFIPKSIYLSQEVMDILIREFDLFDINVIDIRHWNHEDSQYSGTIIFPEGQFLCLPYNKGENEFLLEHPDGEVWKLKQKVSHQIKIPKPP